jgi:hypothetical protein
MIGPFQEKFFDNGDAIHNLRCALDCAWTDMLKVLIPIYRRWVNSFPPARLNMRWRLSIKGIVSFIAVPDERLSSMSK